MIYVLANSHSIGNTLQGRNPDVTVLNLGKKKGNITDEIVVLRTL